MIPEICPLLIFKDMYFQILPWGLKKLITCWLAVLAATVPATSYTWLALQPGARDLRTFSTAVPPSTLAQRSSTHRIERISSSKSPLRRRGLPPRPEKMAFDQDGSSVYPVATPFKPFEVLLPVRMGYLVKKGVPMEKEGNLVLLK